MSRKRKFRHYLQLKSKLGMTYYNKNNEMIYFYEMEYDLFACIGSFNQVIKKLSISIYIYIYVSIFLIYVYMV